MHRFAWLLLIAQMAPSTAAAEAVFKCPGPSGTVAYQDKPCAGSGEVVHLEDSPPMPSGAVRLIELANRGRIAAGMSSDQVRIAWGKPTSINRSFVVGEIHEQWVYRRGPGDAQYVYLEDGVVTSFN